MFTLPLFDFLIHVPFYFLGFCNIKAECPVLKGSTIGCTYSDENYIFPTPQVSQFRVFSPLVKVNNCGVNVTQYSFLYTGKRCRVGLIVGKGIGNFYRLTTRPPSTTLHATSKGIFNKTNISIQPPLTITKNENIFFGLEVISLDLNNLCALSYSTKESSHCGAYGQLSDLHYKAGTSSPWVNKPNARLALIVSVSGTFIGPFRFAVISFCSLQKHDLLGLCLLLSNGAPFKGFQ